MTNYNYLYDSDNMNKIVITEKMLKFIKKHYKAITFIDCKTGKNNTIILDDCFNCKQIIINF
jgi:hypothetical protein